MCIYVWLREFVASQKKIKFVEMCLALEKSYLSNQKVIKWKNEAHKHRITTTTADSREKPHWKLYLQIPRKTESGVSGHLSSLHNVTIFSWLSRKSHQKFVTLSYSLVTKTKNLWSLSYHTMRSSKSSPTSIFLQEFTLAVIKLNTSIHLSTQNKP